MGKLVQGTVQALCLFGQASWGLRKDSWPNKGYLRPAILTIRGRVLRNAEMLCGFFLPFPPQNGNT